MSNKQIKALNKIERKIDKMFTKVTYIRLYLDLIMKYSNLKVEVPEDVAKSFNQFSFGEIVFDYMIKKEKEVKK